MQTRPRILFVLSACAAVLLATSCSTPPCAPTSGFIGGNGSEVLGVQYAPVTGSDGYETAEVFLVNKGGAPVTFTNAVLDGMVLQGEKELASRLVANRFRFDIGGRRVSAPKPVENGTILWSQFYPDSTVAPGAAAVFQIGFRDKAAQSCGHTLSLAVSDGSVLEASIPRRFPTAQRITAVAWTEDGSAVTIQLSNGAPPSALRLNGRSVPFRTLAPAVAGRPGAIVADTPSPVRNGDMVLLEVDFGTETIRAFLRAMPAFAIDAPAFGADDKQLPAAQRKAFGLDEKRSFTRLPFDVACDDTRAGRHGDHARAVVAARIAAFRADPSRLHGLDFCTALYGSIWNIYAAMTDAVIVKPYQLHWGPDPARFIESEITHIDRAVAAAAPKPVIWVPDRFKRHRHLEGNEMEILAWCAALRGVKGIRHHFWLNHAKAPFNGCEDIRQTLPILNRDLAKLRSLLSPLVPASSVTDRRLMVSILEGWSGDSGALLLVRNMRYTTDEEANDGGRTHRFRTNPADKVTISYAIPPWLNPAHPINPLTGEALPASRVDDRLKITLPTLDAFRLVWIANKNR